MRILVVDDDVELGSLVAKLLELDGHKVTVAPDALAGWDLLDAGNIDLIITDLMLPHMDGISFVRRVRADSRFDKVAVILITAYDYDENIDEGLRRGVAFVLPKPIDFDRLRSIVRFAE